MRDAIDRRLDEIERTLSPTEKVIMTALRHQVQVWRQTHSSRHVERTGFTYADFKADRFVKLKTEIAEE